MRTTPDVLVVGGGVIGCAVARVLARAGRTVLLADRGALGGEASSSAAGVLAVASGSEPAGPRLEQRRQSLALYPALSAALREETGLDVGLARPGVVELALTDADARAAQVRLAERRAQGFAVEWLDAAALRAAQPLASPDARGALHFPEDGLVEGARLVAVLAAAARARGAELIPGAAVRGAERAGDRVTRVDVAGEWVSPGTVVLAAGAWSARVPDVAPRVRVAPSRGQMLALRPPEPASGPVLAAGDGYLVPAGGEVLVGATFEDVGFEKAVTPAGVAVLLGHVERMAPALRAAPIVRLWSGLRPHALDGDPIVARAPDTANLILACGHHRNGILLAPWTAETVAGLA